MISWIAPSATIFAAVVAALLAYLNNNRMHRSQERLKWTNAQLGEFYGPLFSLSQAGEAAWLEFRNQVAPGAEYLFAGELTETQKEEWRRWMTSVFMPINRRMHELIISRSHLLVGDEYPPQFVAFCAHVAAYEVILFRWSLGDHSVINSTMRFPQDYRQHIAQVYTQLKGQQQALLRYVQPRSVA
ncbi:MAG TPA: hypothetical protein VL652_23955 [Kutzneria sp.]|jgi:hypothetical protein|nr:hypothetical protein [Kutzneria sp.]